MKKFSTSQTLAVLGMLARLSSAELKNVFAHYMVGGMSTVSQAEQDVADAQAIGIDAFALNVQDPTSGWSTGAIAWLFEAAEAADFKLFFSLDMAVLSDPSVALDLVKQYVVSDAYYTHDGAAFLSTFNGGQISADVWTNSLLGVVEKDTGKDVFFVPDFDDWGGSSGYDAAFFEQFGSVIDGAFSWESAWPKTTDGDKNASSEVDAASLAAAHDVEKVYMMPVSSVQFKHIDSGQNWFRRGQLNLVQRMSQALEIQPDFVELITWNDVGESHNFGNSWPEAVASAPAIRAYTDGFDHTAWRHLIAPFISAYKNGATSSEGIVPYGAFAAAFWYRGLLTQGRDASAACPNDALNFPDGGQNEADAVNVAVLLPSGSTGVSIVVTSAGEEIARYKGVGGLNAFTVTGIKAGAQKVELVANGTVIGTGESTVDVVEQADLCNFNYHVVHVA